MRAGTLRYCSTPTIPAHSGTCSTSVLRGFYEAVGAGSAVVLKRSGPPSAYLGTYKDKAAQWLDGGRSYRLRVPPDPPIKLFWSVTVYDIDTRPLISNDLKIADRLSRMDLRKNADGSVEIYCGGARRFRKELDPDRLRQESFPYFGSTSRPKPSIAPGRCRTSNKCRTNSRAPRNRREC
jgi:Protein of unknown function (DUF1214)